MADSDRSTSGYRVRPGTGPAFRTDVVDVYVFRRSAQGEIEFLQLLRSGEPLRQTWQPVMGHIEAQELAPQTALRELLEEIGLDASSSACLGFWQLEQVYPYYLADLDAIVASPRFAAEVSCDFEAVLNHEHTAHRWTSDDNEFMWPGQRLALAEVRTAIAPHDAAGRSALALSPG